MLFPYFLHRNPDYYHLLVCCHHPRCFRCLAMSVLLLNGKVLLTEILKLFHGAHTPQNALTLNEEIVLLRLLPRTFFTLNV